MLQALHEVTKEVFYKWLLALIQKWFPAPVGCRSNIQSCFHKLVKEVWRFLLPFTTHGCHLLCPELVQQCWASMWSRFLGLNHSSPVLRRDFPSALPKCNGNVPGFFVIHEECFLPFVLIHQKDIKRMLLKIPNFGQNESENGEWETAVRGLGMRALNWGVPFLNHNATSKASQRFLFQVIVFPTCLDPVAEFVRAS